MITKKVLALWLLQNVQTMPKEVPQTVQQSGQVNIQAARKRRRQLNTKCLFLFDPSFLDHSGSLGLQCGQNVHVAGSFDSVIR